MSPRIAIPMPTSTDQPYNQLNWPAFARAVTEAGGEPVACALDLDDHALASLARTCQAVLLPGSPADVDPLSYGQPREAATAPADVARERTDRFLLEHAYHQRKPILGVCFGAQILNVFRGGTLVQDLSVLPVNHAASGSVLTAHTAAVAPASMLGRLIDAQEAVDNDGLLRLPINSSHHQAIGIVGDGLHVTARCPQDAVVESIESGLTDGQPHFVLGVQWHPERTLDLSPSSRALFTRLVHEARLGTTRAD